MVWRALLFRRWQKNSRTDKPACICGCLFTAKRRKPLPNFEQDKDSHIGQYWRQDDPQHYSPASIAAEGIKACFAADAPDADVQHLIKDHKADALAPMATAVVLTAANFGSVKKVYIHTTQDNAVSYYLQQLMVKQNQSG